MLLLLNDIIFQILRALGRYYFLYVEISDFYVNQSLAGQTIHYSIVLLIMINKRLI
jgi:hypothetical protein